MLREFTAAAVSIRVHVSIWLAMVSVMEMKEYDKWKPRILHMRVPGRG